MLTNASIRSVLLSDSSATAGRTNSNSRQSLPPRPERRRSCCWWRLSEAPVLGNPGSKGGQTDRGWWLNSTISPLVRFTAKFRASADRLCWAAAVVKLALNQLIASLSAAFALSLGFVQRQGIDIELFMILRDSALYAPTFDKSCSGCSTAITDANFPTKHLIKDTDLLSLKLNQLGLISAVLSVGKFWNGYW